MFPKSEQEFLNLASSHNLIPVFKEYSAALETPLGAFLKLKQDSPAYLLESVLKGREVGRYSFVGYETSLTLEAKNKRVKVCGNEIKEYESDDPLGELENIFKKCKSPKISNLPDFSGGAIGYFGYDMIRYFEDIPKNMSKDDDYPDFLFMFSDNLIIFDHVKQTLKIVVNVHVDINPKLQYQEALEKIDSIYLKLQNSNIPTRDKKNRDVKVEYKENLTEEEFKDMVKKAKAYIENGDIFQVVLALKTEFELNLDPIEIYSNLRSLNPSPYMFYLDFNDIKLIGSSPEIMVRVKDEEVELRPIAGTRPRGLTEKEDTFLINELLNDEKEKAEHLMLVDLGRNDLGRICEYKSVEVEDFMQVEKYSHVSHLVSKVTGKLKKGYTSFDALRATFPAGTVSGAPKIRALEIIDELEKDSRGPYSGALGHIGYNGNLDTCITIRTLMINKNKAFIESGAGIVYDSSPEKEYNEAKNKAKALIKALEVTRGGSL